MADRTNREGVPIEPRGEIRTAIHAIREVYLALLAEGFTEAEALTIVGKMLQAAMLGGQGQS